MERKHILIAAAVALLAFVGGFAYALMTPGIPQDRGPVAREEGDQDPFQERLPDQELSDQELSDQEAGRADDSETGEEPGQDSPAEAVIEPDSEPHTHTDSVLVRRYYWEDGVMGREVREPLPRELIGMTREELSTARPEWAVVEFSPDEVAAAVACRTAQEGFLGIIEDRVAIFDGQPDSCSRIREVTDIPVAALPDYQVADLRNGVVFRSRTEMLQLLEGLETP